MYAFSAQAALFPTESAANATLPTGLYQVLQKGIEGIEDDLWQICIFSKLWQMAASAHFA